MLSKIDQLMGTLLETWGQRYQLSHDRVAGLVTFSVPGFSLVASEDGNGSIQIEFEESGQKHRVNCPIEEAPQLIESLLFPVA
ncbi:MAG: hypothetical protein H7144_08665 [Burkholderiales bacterium]|nr:hypothetical protein [Phycisphaerae bacterium]